MKKIFYIALLSYIPFIICYQQQIVDILDPNLIQERKECLDTLHMQTYDLCYEDCVPTVSALAQLLQLRIRMYQETYVSTLSQLQQHYEAYPSTGLLRQFLLRERKFQSFVDTMAHLNVKLWHLHQQLLPAITATNKIKAREV